MGIAPFPAPFPSIARAHPERRNMASPRHVLLCASWIYLVAGLLGEGALAQDVTMSDLGSIDFVTAPEMDDRGARRGEVFDGTQIQTVVGLGIGESATQDPSGDSEVLVSGGQKVIASTFTAPITAGSEEKMFYTETQVASSTAIPSQELGELLSTGAAAAEAEALMALETQRNDPTNAALFDLVPIWKGMVADDVRSAAMVENCIPSMDMWITRSICTEWGPAVIDTDEEDEGNSTNATRASYRNGLLFRKAKLKLERRDTTLGEGLKQPPADVCRKYSLEPMSDAMNELWQHIQRGLFVCSKRNHHCDASLCYRHPGPMDDENEPTAQFHTFSQIPLSVVHNKTQSGDTVVQQMVDLDMKLEKINVCEKLTPEVRVPGSPDMSQPSVCHVAKKCKIVNARFGDCYDGVQENKPQMTCPDDDDFKQKLRTAQMEIATMMCNRA